MPTGSLTAGRPRRYRHRRRATLEGGPVFCSVNRLLSGDSRAAPLVAWCGPASPSWAGPNSGALGQTPCAMRSGRGIAGMPRQPLEISSGSTETKVLEPDQHAPKSSPALSLLIRSATLAACSLNRWIPGGGSLARGKCSERGRLVPARLPDGSRSSPACSSWHVPRSRFWVGAAPGVTGCRARPRAGLGSALRLPGSAFRDGGCCPVCHRFAALGSTHHGKKALSDRFVDRGGSSLPPRAGARGTRVIGDHPMWARIC